ncbi:MAG: hypothetical protein MJ113_02295 [Lachnospiraceae bacterium]|nr:hypothetical protein [Lachnospiraceae bacterium]
MDWVRAFFNSLLHGDKKTKQYLGGIVASFVAFLFFLVLAFFSMPVLNGILSGVGLLTGILLVTNVRFYIAEMKEEEEKEAAREEFLRKKGLVYYNNHKDVSMHTASYVNSYVKLYTKKKIKKLMYAYKVKKENLPVIIDEWKSEKLFNVPAFIWKDKNFLYFLVLDEETKMMKIDRNDLSIIRIKKDVAAIKEDDDLWDSHSLIGKVFNELKTPCYKDEDGTYLKKQYLIGDDIYFRKASIKNVRELLELDIEIDNKKYLTAYYNDYFRNVYKLLLLQKEGLIEEAEYDEKVRYELQGMAESKMKLNVFHEYLAQMLMEGILAKEYGEYALKIRKNLRIKVNND